VGDDARVFDLDALAPRVDRFVAMLFYETGEADPPGPVAALNWYRQWLDAMTRHGDASQWIISIGAFALDWPSEGSPELISFYDAMARSALAQSGPIGNPPPYEGPAFMYHEQGVTHDVWFLDATTFWNQQRLALQRSVGGIGIDPIGSEDPLVWQALRCQTACAPTDFEAVPSGDAIGTVGDGDFLTVDGEHRSGRRRIEVDADGLWSVSYADVPRTPTVTRTGHSSADKVAITFDDGPDPEWTPQILDILRDENVQAAFFVVGSHTLEHPDLLRRIVADGHLIGNHSFSHPDLSRTGAVRTEFELNATQRAIETITGRSTLLFRPPYDADRTPHSTEELAPLVVAQKRKYIPTAASIDPLDWEEHTADEIVQRVKQERARGSVLLLHDAGGDRSQTVAALRPIIHYLKARGDTIVPLHELLGVSREALMPPIPAEDPAAQRVVAGTGLSLLETAQQGLRWFLVVSTALLCARNGFIVILAARRARRERMAQTEVQPFAPPVSVILPAHNEEKVIRQTLTALLSSRYAGAIEILVVDDGSSDATAAIVNEMARADSRLRLVRQKNQGKAEALRNGLCEARHRFIVTLDADTEFALDAIAELVRPLQSPMVGAVSGHIGVGKSGGLLGRFQALEYMSGFNLDRRAYDVLNSITVVPGAASAYRVEAIAAAGGIRSDTLAEDTDLTLALHRTGYRIRHNPRARATTEAPQSVTALLRQRKRWAFGTLQCLWKHRVLLGNYRYRWLGLFALPSIWFFHIFLVALVPLVDFSVVIALLSGESGPLLLYAAALMAVDLVLAATACRLEGEPLRTALLSIPMRFAYRPLLSLAVLASLYRALRGRWMAWGFQERWGLVHRWTGSST
jgi:cellulose synthase/poly-beta-1,6-N-acetylglucosamine synthase-like glycosyltransferase/peptidoglycan/xylan/chitin deacetylase (PgdA/CDA1 family)